MSSPPQHQTFSLFNLIASLRGVATPSSSGSQHTNNRAYSSVAAAAAASQATSSTTPSTQPSSSSSNPASTTTTASITIPIPRRRGSHASDGSTGGFVERPGPAMYIGGKLETGEVKFYKLGLMRAKMSDTSLDKMSL